MKKFEVDNSVFKHTSSTAAFEYSTTVGLLTTTTVFKKYLVRTVQRTRTTMKNARNLCI